MPVSVPKTEKVEKVISTFQPTKVRTLVLSHHFPPSSHMLTTRSISSPPVFTTHQSILTIPASLPCSVGRTMTYIFTTSSTVLLPKNRAHKSTAVHWPVSLTIPNTLSTHRPKAGPEQLQHSTTPFDTTTSARTSTPIISSGTPTA